MKKKDFISIVLKNKFRRRIIRDVITVVENSKTLEEIEINSLKLKYGRLNSKYLFNNLKKYPKANSHEIFYDLDRNNELELIWNQVLLTVISNSNIGKNINEIKNILKDGDYNSKLYLLRSVARRSVKEKSNKLVYLIKEYTLYRDENYVIPTLKFLMKHGKKYKFIEDLILKKIAILKTSTSSMRYLNEYFLLQDLHFISGNPFPSVQNQLLKLSKMDDFEIKKRYMVKGSEANYLRLNALKFYCLYEAEKSEIFKELELWKSKIINDINRDLLNKIEKAAVNTRYNDHRPSH